MKLLIAFFALVFACSAAEVAGKWNLIVPMRDGGELKAVLMIKQAGSGYTGTISTEQGDAELTEIKVTDSDFTCKIPVDAVTYEISATVTGDSMKGKYKVNDRDGGPFTGTRDAAKPSSN